MYQIDNSSSVTALPAPAAAGRPGFFIDADLVAGTPGTNVPADFLNMIMMELANVILGVGGTLDKNNRNQLGGAMPAIFSQSLVFPSGIIINFGNAAQPDGTGKTSVVFQTPFKVGVLVPLVVNQAGAAPSAFHGVGAQSKTGMDIWSAQSSGVASGAGTSFYWFALGR